MCRQCRQSTTRSRPTGPATAAATRRTWTPYGSWSMERSQQTISSALLTGHCGLNAHLKRIGVWDTSTCACETTSSRPSPCPQRSVTNHGRRVWTWLVIAGGSLPGGGICGITRTENCAGTVVERRERCWMSPHCPHKGRLLCRPPSVSARGLLDRLDRLDRRRRTLP